MGSAETRLEDIISEHASQSAELRDATAVCTRLRIRGTDPIWWSPREGVRGEGRGAKYMVMEENSIWVVNTNKHTDLYNRNAHLKPV